MSAIIERVELRGLPLVAARGPLTILSAGYPLAPFGPEAVGGTEQILSRIDHALTVGGHNSLVVGCEGSQAFGELFSTGTMPGVLDEKALREAQSRTLRTIEKVLRERPVDVIHMHGLDFASYLPATELPIIGTLHLPPSWYPPDLFNRNGNLSVHCVSAAQRRACPPHAKLLPQINNGVPIPDGPLAQKEDFVLAMGRVCPEKGFHLAAEAALRARVPLVLAGEVFGYDSHKAYFESQLQPLLNGRVRFIGPARGECKRRLLRSARCVLVPSLVPETSCLVALEAMAAGTPVIAFPAGALADIVKDGETGFIVNDAAEMAEAIKRTDEISPSACRRYVQENYCMQTMTSSYLDLYRRTAASWNPSRPATDPRVEIIRGRAATTALIPEWRELFANWSADPEQNPDQLERRWNCTGCGELMLITLRSQGELLGLIPLHLTDRVLRLMGRCVLAKPEWKRALIDGLVDALCSLASDWSSCDFDRLPDASPLLIARVPARFDVAIARSAAGWRTWRLLIHNN